MTTGTSSLRRTLNLKGLIGPALVAGVAYIDPGNIATNLTAGSRYGYLLVWVLVSATLSAALFQFLSAKLGIVTGQSLPAVLGSRFKHNGTRLAFWAQAEAVAIATDVAEVLGGAIALSLLTQAPLIVSALAVGFISLVINATRAHGKTQFNRVIIFLMLAATLGFAYIMLKSQIMWSGLVQGLVPRISDGSSLLLATGIIGATIMPHAIYAHSSLSKENSPNLSMLERIRGAKTDVALAMGVAGVGNLAVLVFSAANLFGKGDLATLTGASGLLSAQMGSSIGLLFVVALFASGLASSAVGNFAASEIATGLLKRKIHPVVRWSLALGPALLLIAFTPNVTDAVIFSQVVLSFGLPFAIFPLVKLTADSKVMGALVSPRRVTILGYTLASLLTLLNLALVGSVFFLN